MAHFEILITVLLFSQSAFGLRCFICNSGVDSDCAVSSPSEKYLMECSERFSSAPQTHLQPLNHETHEANQTHSPDTPNNETDTQSNTTGVSESDHEHSINRTLRSVADNNEPGPFTTDVKLPKEAIYCRKISYHIPAQNNGPESKLEKSVRVVRSCGFASATEDKKDDADHQIAQCKWIGTDGIQMDECKCFGDGCNSGFLLSSLTKETLLLISLIATVYFHIL